MIEASERPPSSLLNVPLLLLALLFVTVPLVELYVILEVGDAIGPLATIGILAADSLVGAALLRSQGRAVWRRFQRAIEQRSVPHRELLDGVLVIFGGAFLITPGFITDLFGLLFLLPPTRAVFRGAILRILSRRIEAGAVVVASGAAERSRRRRAESGEDFVEGTAWEDAPAERIERTARRR
jgi:UPF0716 protein FxsA